MCTTVNREACWVHNGVQGGMMGVYYGTMVGMYQGGYTTYPPWSVYTPGYTSLLPIHPGYTTIPPYVQVYPVMMRTTLSVRENESWALTCD